MGKIGNGISAAENCPLAVYLLRVDFWIMEPSFYLLFSRAMGQNVLQAPAWAAPGSSLNSGNDRHCWVLTVSLSSDFSDFKTLPLTTALVFFPLYLLIWASQVAQWERIWLLTQEMWVRSLGGEDPLEKEMATHSSILSLGNSMDRGTWQPQSKGSQKS